MNKRKLAIASVVVISILSVVFFRPGCSEEPSFDLMEVHPKTGSIETVIMTTGTVLPRNRLELKPPISGRVDKILVREGQYVKAGAILAWMSSMERAALIDAARAQGASSVKYWKSAYKSIPLVAPISGKVIVRSVEPGQTVTSTTPILVLSDRLIVKADVDETDIGRVSVGQKAMVSLDAYQDVTARGRVVHISHESKVTNNVTIYEIDIMPDKVPAVFRSGMSANVTIVEKRLESVLLISGRALIYKPEGVFVLVKGRDGKLKKRKVETGISSEDKVEIRSGIDKNDTVVIKIKRVNRSGEEQKGNPFLPSFKKKKKKK